MLPQADLDAAVQASLYTQEKNFFIAHQDRPYVVNLSNALYLKCIPLEQIYCCGVFGLPKDTVPVRPALWKTYPHLDTMKKGRTVIFSPYAKSVPSLPDAVWGGLVRLFADQGYRLLTNVVAGEDPLPGTEALSPDLTEMKSVAEYAGTFIGIRSGLCDLLREADCVKVALYPDYYYMDTKWKAMEMYPLDGWHQEVIGNATESEDVINRIAEVALP